MFSVTWEGINYRRAGKKELFYFWELGRHRLRIPKVTGTLNGN